MHSPGGMLRSPPQGLDGGAMLYLRQLQRVYGEGNVQGVSVQEWQALGGDAGRQEALLQALLWGGQQPGGVVRYEEPRAA